MSRQPARWGEPAGLLEVRPLDAPLPPPTWSGSFSSPFSAPLASTLTILRREVAHLAPRQVILEADFAPTALRADGLPRADRQARSPGVILTLVGTSHGDLRYPCHAFGHWDENLRAIALALEALRKVDRYGVTQHGEQYRGWKALPTGSGVGYGDPVRGRRLIEAAGGDVRAALKAAHPDAGGEPDDFRDVIAARDAA